jgi:hypothetical protein
MGRFLRHPGQGSGWSTARFAPHPPRGSDHHVRASTAARWLARAGCDVILLPTQTPSGAQKVPWDLRRLPVGRTELAAKADLAGSNPTRRQAPPPNLSSGASKRFPSGNRKIPNFCAVYRNQGVIDEPPLIRAGRSIVAVGEGRVEEGSSRSSLSTN